MRTETEVRAELATKLEQQGSYSDPCQKREVATDIARMKWMLGEGPNVVIVPKPNVERRHLDQAGD
jgi:hypothetical protein